jgi:hypothetical protein
MLSIRCYIRFMDLVYQEILLLWSNFNIEWKKRG